MKKILIIPVGLVPQIVTESIYALACSENPWIPDRVVLITTSTGKDRITNQIIDEGWLNSLTREYKLPNIQITNDDIKLITDDDGVPYKDVKSELEMTAASNTISEIIRSLTNENDTEIHTIISGSRTTVGFYLGHALSVYGRENDKLSHIYVDPELEKHPEFYYPPKETKIVYSLDQASKPINIGAAGVHLVNIPFVRLRDNFTNASLEESKPFNEIISEAQSRITKPKLIFDQKKCMVIADEIPVEMPPLTYAWYLWLAQLRIFKEGNSQLVSPMCELTAKEFLNVYKTVVGEMSYDYETAENNLSSGLDKEYIWERNSRLKESLVRHLGARSELYDVAAFGKRPNTRYGLDISQDLIEIIEN